MTRKEKVNLSKDNIDQMKKRKKKDGEYSNFWMTYEVKRKNILTLIVNSFMAVIIIIQSTSTATALAPTTLQLHLSVRFLCLECSYSSRDTQVQCTLFYYMVVKLFLLNLKYTFIISLENFLRAAHWNVFVHNIIWKINEWNAHLGDSLCTVPTVAATAWWAQV